MYKGRERTSQTLALWALTCEIERLTRSNLLLVLIASLIGAYPYVSNHQERLYTVMCAFIAIVVMSIFISSITATMLDFPSLTELEKVMSEATRNSRLLDSYLRRHGRERSNTAFYARTYFRKVQSGPRNTE
eukprot:6369054-Amphidinium_carterae.3